MSLCERNKSELMHENVNFKWIEDLYIRKKKNPGQFRIKQSFEEYKLFEAL